MSVFQPPQYSNSFTQRAPMQASNGAGAPPSPVKGLGYVGGSGGALDDMAGLNGYVGEKPAEREEGQNPQSLRRQTNLASPDPALSQAAFTQSQFTTNISAAALQSQTMREGNQTSAAGVAQDSSSSDFRRDRLRQYKQSTGGAYRNGGSCGFTPHPSFNNRTSMPSSSTTATQTQTTQRPVNSRGPRDNAPILQQQTSNFAAPSSESRPPQAASSQTAAPTTIVAYTIADPGSMFKSFSSSLVGVATGSWFGVIHLIVPPGKTAKRVHLACMILRNESDMSMDGQGDDANHNAGNPSYALRVVNSEGATLISRYDCDNSDNFKVFTLDLTTVATTPGSGSGGLLEVQAQNVTGNTLLFSSAILEF